MGELAMGNNSYSVASPEGQPIWSGKYQQKDYARPLMDSPDCGLVQTISEQIVVSEGKFSKWQFSSFDFSLTSAYVAGVSAEITVNDANLADIPAGKMTAQPLNTSGLRSDPANRLPGAFRIWTSWTLSNPLDSSRIARLEAERIKLP